ncbi:MAG: 50S ribosomal protein L31 [Candidatus Moranbacteria bacterium RIFCSPLOWO2_02_FULL_48_19]|nr:MAG: 50S ribosomal protein L31 [Candidatus Moranbacteria bacterium RIFCSPLOWO2_02_FULL_48_19]OGI30411.1 MAG: 50S ribosomal protein L31 [Candidatus Moranbacteria bacterium RIFCSPLOWO2_12_FULL_48_12]
MKQGIHPTYFKVATITCACGAVLHTGSAVETMKTEICSQCHPFYTGKKKFIDATGRVDRFKKLSEKSAVKQAARLDSARLARLKAVKAKAATETPEVEKEKKAAKKAS